MVEDDVSKHKVPEQTVGTQIRLFIALLAESTPCSWPWDAFDTDCLGKALNKVQELLSEAVMGQQ